MSNREKFRGQRIYLTTIKYLKKWTFYTRYQDLQSALLSALLVWAEVH
jgi:hypothetical protein